MRSSAQIHANDFLAFWQSKIQSLAAWHVLGLGERGSAFLYEVSDRLLRKNVSESFHRANRVAKLHPVKCRPGTALAAGQPFLLARALR